MKLHTQKKKQQLGRGESKPVLPSDYLYHYIHRTGAETLSVIELGQQNKCFFFF